MFRFISACSAERHLAKSCLLVFHRSSSVTKLERLQRLCQRLEQLQGRVRCPRLEFFTVGSETFKLPLRAVDPPAEKPCRQELEYLVVFFDGDGSVTLIQTNGFMRLQVDQNIDSAQVLLRFRRALGGSIVNSQNSSGRHKACLKWSTYGRQAASWLGRIASVKQAQLKIAAAGRVERGDRELVIQKLLELKQHSFEPPAVNCSWQYFAGFFDADGNISVLPALPSISLRVSQKNPFGLSCLLLFLHQQGQTSWRLSPSERCFTLICTGNAACRESLELLLENGLFVKKEQAELALTLTAGNHKQVREAMSRLKGHQNRYRRLDAAGMDRSKKIARLNQRLRNASTSLQDKEQIEQELCVLRQEHARQNLICKASALRFDIRRLLREGASICHDLQ